MSNYPPFSYQPQMNPYQQQNNYQPMQNQYIPQMGQYQQNFQPQIQQIQQPIGLVGRAVNDFSEIKADDVPMNGTPAIFVKNDMSEIEVRIWGKDGLIRPTSYKPILEQNNADATNIPQMDFNALNEDVRALMEDIKGVREMIEKSMNAPTQKTTSSRGKKGADEE